MPKKFNWPCKHRIVTWVKSASLNVCHEARHLTSDQDSEQIAALKWPSLDHAHQIYNLQNQIGLFYAAQDTMLEQSIKLGQQ